MHRTAFVFVVAFFMAPLLFARPADTAAASLHFWCISEGPFPTHVDVDFFWSHSKYKKYTKFEFCWRSIDENHNGKNPCNYKTRKIDKTEIHFKAANEVIHGSKVYKYRIRAKRASDGKWIILTPTDVNPCFRMPVDGHQPLELSCGPN